MVVVVDVLVPAAVVDVDVDVDVDVVVVVVVVVLSHVSEDSNQIPCDVLQIHLHFPAHGDGSPVVVVVVDVVTASVVSFEHSTHEIITNFPR